MKPKSLNDDSDGQLIRRFVEERDELVFAKLIERRGALVAGVCARMLRNHAENQWSIGTISGALQPIVVRNGLQGLPAKALYSWEPTAMLGIYRVDEIFWNKAAGKEARR